MVGWLALCRLFHRSDNLTLLGITIAWHACHFPIIEVRDPRVDSILNSLELNKKMTFLRYSSIIAALVDGLHMQYRRR